MMPILAKEIRDLMNARNTRLVLAADFNTISEISNILSLVGNHIFMLKTHIDGIRDFTLDRWMREVVYPAQRAGILIFEDRKFADIGSITKNQMLGHQRIAEWADIVTAHRISGPDLINGVHMAWAEVGRKGSVVILSQMSSSLNMLDDSYCKKVVKSCKEISGVCGFIGNGSDPAGISRLRASVGVEKLILTPGINLDVGKGGMGQRYGHPKEAIASGADAVIVGSGIIGKSNPSEAAGMYARSTMEEM